jgi:hypothetical protein
MTLTTEVAKKSLKNESEKAQSFENPISGKPGEASGFAPSCGSDQPDVRVPSSYFLW